MLNDAQVRSIDLLERKRQRARFMPGFTDFRCPAPTVFVMARLNSRDCVYQEGAVRRRNESLPRGSCVSWRIAKGSVSRSDAAQGLRKSCTGTSMSQLSRLVVSYASFAKLGVCVSRVRAQGSTRPASAESLIFFVATRYWTASDLIVSNVVSIGLLVE